MSNASANPDTPKEAAETLEAVPDFVSLASGRELDIAAAEVIVTARPVQLIVIAGPVDCGKTTLLTAIYESFQWGDFAGYQFVASETLPGFERRCFLSRTASGRDEPETGRTPIGEAAFLHFRVRSAADVRSVNDVLLTDLSGEMFRQARDFSEECERLGFLARADHVVFLIDGKKLAEPRTRWSVTQDSLSLLQAFLDNQMLARSAYVEIIFSKWDFVRAAPDFGELETLVETIEQQFRERFALRVGRLQFGRIAARPRGGILPFAHGLDVVFQDWLTTSPRLRKPNLATRVQGNRESERFLARQLRAPSSMP